MEINNEQLYYLRFLNDFWIRFYKNQSLVLEGALSATADIIKNFYFAFLQRQLPTEIIDFPIFQEQFWNVIVFKDTNRTAVDINLNETTDSSKIKFIRYPLDESYSSIPFLYNTIFDPTLFLMEGLYKDFIKELKPDTDNTLIIGFDYINEWSGEIICGNETIQSGETFSAKSDSYTLSDPGLTGSIRRNQDYFIQTIQTDIDPDSATLFLNSFIYFPKDKDIYLNEDIAQRLLPNEQAIEIALFAPKVYIDYQELYKLYGSIIGVTSKTSLEYKNFIAGILQLYQTGPMVVPMNIALNVSNGYPVARNNEIITKIEIQENFYILTSSKDNEYKIKRTVIEEVYVDPSIDDIVKERKALPRLNISNPSFYLKKIKQQFLENGNTNIPSINQIVSGAYSLMNPFTNQTSPYRDFTNLENFIVGESYDVYWEVEQYDGFIDQLKVVDYKSQEKWWLDKMANSKMLESIVTISDNARSDITVIDYLFENILKYNTFGIFIDARITSNFQGITDFIRIINEVKPTYKTFLVNEQDLNTYSEIESQDDSSVNLNLFLPLETNYKFVPKIGMNMLGLDPVNPYSLEKRIKMGQRLEDIGSAYLDLHWTIQILATLLDDETAEQDVPSSSLKLGFPQRLIIGAPGLHLGKHPDEGIYDFCNFFTLEMPDDIVALPATNITVTGFRANWENNVGVDVNFFVSLSFNPEMTNLVPGFESIQINPGITFYDFTLLTFNTPYYYQVSGTNSNSWPINPSNVVSLQTLLYPNPVATDATSINSLDALANWEPYPYSNDFFIDVIDLNTMDYVPGFQNLAVTGVFKLITGLAPLSNYKFVIRANINNGEYITGNSNEIFFTTAENPAVAFAATDITEMSFIAHFQHEDGAIDYRIDVLESLSPDTYVPGYENKTTQSGVFTTDYTTNPTYINITNHNLQVNQTLFFKSGGTIPSGLTADTTYYVKTIIDANNIEVSLTINGPAITLTSNGSGIHSYVCLSEYIDGLLENQTYYYRVRVNKGTVSVNSNVITVITGDYIFLWNLQE